MCPRFQHLQIVAKVLKILQNFDYSKQGVKSHIDLKEIKYK